MLPASAPLAPTDEPAVMAATVWRKLRRPRLLRSSFCADISSDNRRFELRMRYHPLRWIAFSVFVFSSTLNYVDRFLLNQLGPLIISDLGMNKITFGWVLSASSITYAGASLFAGWMLDRSRRVSAVR